MLVVLWSLFVSLFAETFNVDGIRYYITSNLTVEVTSKSPVYIGEIIIPKTVDYDGKTYSVTSIGDHAFYDCRGLTSVTIPNSVISIGNDAFCGCRGLTSVTIPNSVTSIGNDAFERCSGLTSVTIGNGVTSIGKFAFSGCSGLTSVIIPNSVTSIGNDAFYGCRGLTSVTIHCKEVDSWFSGMTSIKEVVLGDSVTSIGDHAFERCSGLTSLTIPNSVTSIGDWAFRYCCLTSVTSLNTIPPKVGFDTFGREYVTATLYVPIGCKNIYSTIVYWCIFTKIEEIDVSDISNTILNNYDYGTIYNINGIKVNESNLVKGIYIKNGKTVIIK